MHLAKKEVLYLTVAIVLLVFLVKVTAIDLSSFPEEYKEKDVKIIVGENADRSDMLDAKKIADFIKSEGKVIISSKAEKFEIGDEIDSLELGESLSDVVDAITAENMKGLEGGKITTQEGTTNYNQYLRLLSGNVTMGENDFTGTMLKFESGEETFEYDLSFDSGLGSEVVSNELTDLIDEEIVFMGREYSITGAEKKGNDVVLKLLSGNVKLSLQEGEKTDFNYNGEDYSLEVVLVGNDGSVVLNVNNERSNSLKKGEIDLIGDVLIGISRTIFNEAGEGGDYVGVYVGARKLELNDNDCTDDAFTESGYKINDKRISEANIQIKCEEINNIFKIYNIKYRLEAISDTGGDVYLGFGESFSEKQKGKDDGLDLTFEEISERESSVIEIENSGSSEYNLIFTNVEDNVYNIPLTESDGGLVMGDSGRTLHFIEKDLTDNGAVAEASDFDIEQGDFFVLTNRNKKSSRTHIMKYGSFDSENNELYLDDVAIGSKTIPCTPDDTYGAEVLCKSSIVVGGITYIGYVHVGDYNLMIDLNGDNSINLGEARITVKGGGVIDLGNSESPGASFDLTLTTYSSQFDEGASPNTGGDEVLTFRITESGSNVDLDVISGVDVFYDDVEKKYEFMSSYGVYGELKGKNEDGTEVKMQYPYGQVTYKVTTSFGDSETEIATKNYKKEILLDNEIIIINSDLIVVGGPCVNRIAMTVLDKDKTNCAEGLEEGDSIIKLVPYSGKDVLVVYGLTKKDTRKAVDLLLDSAGQLNGNAVLLTGNVIKSVDGLTL